VVRQKSYETKAAILLRTMTTLLLRLLLLLALQSIAGFAPIAVGRQHHSLEAKDNGVETNESPVEKDMNPLTRASWYAVEAFGSVFGSKKERSSSAASSNIDLTVAPSSLKETLERIQLDNDRSYFLSGEVDKLIYDDDCRFADPFVSFRGRDRFVDNLQNLGSFITKYSAKLLDYNNGDDSDEQVKTRLMVKLELNLPWKPVLAWPWGVTYVIDPVTFLVTDHIESWDIEPLEGVKQIFRKPTTQVKEDTR
jgi:predicted nucleotidyltransferase